MKPHVRRGKKAKKGRQERATLRLKGKSAGGNLSQNSDFKPFSAAIASDGP